MSKNETFQAHLRGCAKFGNGTVQHVDMVEEVDNCRVSCISKLTVDQLTMHGHPFVPVFTFGQLYRCTQITRALQPSALVSSCI